VGVGAVDTAPTSATFDSNADSVYVTNSGSATVSVITGGVATNISVGSDPDAALYNPSSGYVYVTNTGSNNVSVLTGAAVVGSVNVGTGPTAEVFANSNGYVYVTDSGSNRVSLVSGTSAAGTVTVGSHPSSAVYDSFDQEVLVTNQGSNNVSLVSGESVENTVDVGSAPDGSNFVANKNYDYVSDALANTVSVVRFSTAPGNTVDFNETGLASGTRWAVTFAGLVASSSSSQIVFHELNGTYPYVVGSVAGYGAVPLSGSLWVHGLPSGVQVRYTLGAQRTYEVTFAETGLAMQTLWTVTINGSVEKTSNPTIMVAEPNGTYPFTVGAVQGYSETPASGTASVNGSNPVPVQLNFVPGGNATHPLFGATFWIWAIVALVVLGVAVGGVLVWAQRRRPPRGGPP
jgi:YVTN family beta-propeller protein